MRRKNKKEPQLIRVRGNRDFSICSISGFLDIWKTLLGTFQHFDFLKTYVSENQTYPRSIVSLDITYSTYTFFTLLLTLILPVP